MSSLDALVARMNQLAEAVPLDHATTPAEEVEANKIAAKMETPTAKIRKKLEPTSETELIRYVQDWNEGNEEDGQDLMSAEEMLERLQEAVKYRAPESPISDQQLKEIIEKYAPNAPRQAAQPSAELMEAERALKKPAFPSELASLVDSGHVFYENEHWFVKRCSKCGQFGRDECCGQKTSSVLAVRSDGVLTRHGRQAAGLDPITPPASTSGATPELKKSWVEMDWWSTFSGFDELEDGGLKMYIENFLPEGVTIISSLPKEGKTWLALSIVKALTTGQPLLGKPGFEVPEQVPVLYLAAEVSDRAFKHRVSKFGITNDKTKFLCRTLTKGMIGLQNPELEAAIRALKPIVILDVLSCFNQSEDEDDAVQNQKLRSMIGNLRTQGAPVIIVLHHTTKDFKDKPTKEKAVRGSGDILAMVDVVWALMMDDRLFQAGIKEIDLIGWGRDFEASPIRLALTRKTGAKTLSTFGPGVISVVDETGDLGWVDKEAVREAAEKADQALEDTLVRMVQADPKASLRALAETVGQSYRRVRDTLEDLGWTRGKSKHAVWTKADD